ncbi:MAG: HAMP domain-containing protein [Clostridiales bacterium]|nr:HAMP domain-containing protein [Clostridiales bacterium]
MTKTHSIKKAIWIRVSAILLMVLICAATIITGISLISATNNSVTKATNINALALGAEKAHYSWIENLSSAINYGTEFTGSTDCTACDLGQWLYGTDPNSLLDPQLGTLIEEMKPIHEEIHDSATEILELNKTNPERAKDQYLNETKTNVNKLMSLLAEVKTITNDLVIEKEAILNIAIIVTLVCSCVSIALVIIVCMLLVHYTFKKIVSPIQIITKSSQQLSQGNLHFHIDIESKNEIGVLTNSLNSSVLTLQQYVSDISDSLSAISHGDLTPKEHIEYIGDFIPIQKSLEIILHDLNETMCNIQDAAEQVNVSSAHLSNSSQALAQGATEQASEVEKLNMTLHTVSEQIQQNAENATTTSAETNRVGEQIGKCNEQMEHVVLAMNEISQCSSEIENIIKTIEDIAFQTNILALNAAVEAARAGMAGKGFAVVADEVRNLASKSAEAAKNTTALIEKSMRAISNGSSLTQTAQQSLTSVVQGTQVVMENVESISKASHEQANLIHTISDGISQISMVVQNNSATSEESAAASEELSGQAQLLRQMVEKFQIQCEGGVCSINQPKPTEEHWDDLSFGNDKYE